jgi:hypothetical protein
VGSQRGGRGKERGFSLGVDDILAVVVGSLDIGWKGFRCMYG